VTFQSVVLFSTTLLAIVNPVASAVMFAAVAGRFPKAVQRSMANQSGIAILVILIVCAWLGRTILQMLGISTAMLQAAGGLILLRYGLQMVSVEEPSTKLTAAESHRAEEVPEEQWKALAVVPLAIRTVGAGTITTVVIQASIQLATRSTIISGVSLIVSVIVTSHSAPPARSATASAHRHEHRHARHRIFSATPSVARRGIGDCCRGSL
jgi:small neutral amino acid transporter SnatA (MarC family)